VSKLHFKEKESKGNVIQLISKKLYKKNAPFYVSTCSLDELDKKLNHTKMSKS
jgi:hypothetical protein